MVDELFLSNRMELQYGVIRDAVHKIYTEADFDLKQALRNPDSLFREKYKGTGYFTTETARNREAMVRQAAGPLPEVRGGGGLEVTGEMLKVLSAMLGRFESQAVEEAGGDAASLVGVVSEEEAEMLLGMNFTGESHLEAGILQLVWQPNFININDDTTRTGFKLDKKFNPSYMTGPVFALARIWAAFIRLILIKMGSSETWGVGFVFSTEAQGMFYTDNDGGKWIALNPINLSSGKLMNIRDRDDVRRIFEVAMHESAHLLGGSYHGDGFVRSFDSVVRSLLSHWGEAKKIAKGIKVKGVIKKRTGSSIPENTKLFVIPLADGLTKFEVDGYDSIGALSESLDVEERQLFFYLADDELANFYGTHATIEERDQAYSGEIFSMEMSFQWVRRMIKKSLRDDTPEYLKDVIPVRVFLMGDGALWLEPDDPAHRRFYEKRHFGISEASTRTRLTDGDDLEVYLRKIFMNNYELHGWPYNTKDQRPEDMIKSLYQDREVVIPLETSIYECAVDYLVRYEPDLMNKHDSVAVNVTRDGNGQYRLHPDTWSVFEMYRARFDAHPSYFELVLSKKKEKEQIEQQFSPGDMDGIKSGFSTRVAVPTKLFERWLYNHEHYLRRKDWNPVMPDAISELVKGTIRAIAKNLGADILLFEFSGPSEIGMRISGKYMTTPSELMWFVDFKDAAALAETFHTDTLRDFWKKCSPGYMLVELNAREFERGIDDQLNTHIARPGNFMPVWVTFREDVQYFVMTPVLDSHKSYIKSQYPDGEGSLVFQNSPHNLDHVNGFIHSTYNCGHTTSGQEIALNMFDRLVHDELPVMVAVVTDLFMRRLVEGSW